MVLRARWVLLVSIVVGVGIWGYFLAQGRGSVPKYRTAVVGRDKARTGSEWRQKCSTLRHRWRHMMLCTAANQFLNDVYQRHGTLDR